MTPVLILAHAGLAALIGLTCWRAGDATRARVTRVAGTVGVLLALTLVVARATIEPWRAIAFEPGPAAIGGVAVACAWGLAVALDLGRARWWVGAVVGVGSSALLLVGGAQWIVPMLLFAAGLFAAATLALCRSSRTAWLVIALSDTALAVALVGHALDNDSWAVPEDLGGALVIPLGIGLILRAGAIPWAGAGITLRTPATALAPLLTGSAFVLLVRLVERPQPVAAAAGLVCACVVALVAVTRRSLNPATLSAWPVLLGAGIALASARAGVPAAVAAVLGVSAVVLWPDALERGRLSRGFVLSSIAPNVVFGAIATAAAGSFIRATSSADATDAIAWTMISALLPIALASGVALGVMAARSDPRGGYHPEAVFMTWMLVAGSVAGGVLLGAGGVYEVLGGTSAALLFAFALACGAFVAMRARHREAAPLEPLATVAVARTIEPPPWAAGAALGLLVVTATTIGWLTVAGLRTGFL